MFVTIYYRDYKLWKTEQRREAVYFYGVTKYSEGANGTDGGNCETFNLNTFNFYNPMQTFNDYKYFVREHLANNIQVSDLNEFLVYLSKNPDLNKLYTTLDFLAEFDSMEHHYFKLQKQLSFISYYESLRDRIVQYSRTLTGKPDDQKAINFLYTSVLSRLFAIKSQKSNIAVVNLLDYMEIVEKRMKRLQEVKKTEYINQYRDEYKSVLNEKIVAAGNLVQKTVVPRINSIITATDDRIKELLAEIFAKKEKTQKEIAKAKENKKKLESKLLLHFIMAPLKLVGSALSLLGPPGMIAGAAIATGTSIAESVIDSSLTQQKVTVPSGPAKAEVLRISKQAKRNFELLEQQLNDLYVILRNDNCTELKPVERNMDALMVKITGVTKSDEIPNANDIKQIQESRKQLLSVIENTVKALEERAKSDDIIKSAVKKLGYMKNIVKVGEAGVEVYGQIRDDETKIQEVDETLQALDEQLQVFRQHEQNIYNIMIPQLKMVEQSIKFAVENSKGKSHVELDISRWTIQSTLGDVKNLFNQMTKGFLVSSDLERCIEKINEGITTVIDVYDRIDEYTEKSQLANLIADIAVGQNEIQNRELKEAVNKMEIIIKSNLVIEQYSVAILAIKQHKFPFAENYLDEFDLPSNISITDAEFNSKTVDRISELILKIRESKSLIEKRDAYLYSNYSFIDTESFYAWNLANYKDDFQKLLNGDEVTLVADIQDGLKMSAIKFNDIWIKMRLKNESEQSEFDSEIDRFKISLQMVGNGYYRCYKRFYYISLEKTIQFGFSLENGQPTKPNDVLTKLKTGGYFLSPYTTWKISLIPNNNNSNDFSRLKRFRNELDEISLEGYGQYLENKKSFVHDICNDQLDKYYRLDSVEHTLQK